MFLVYCPCKYAKLREVRFTGLAEAELLDKGSQNSAGARPRTRRTGESRREGTGKARGKLDQLPGESKAWRVPWWLQKFRTDWLFMRMKKSQQNCFLLAARLF